VTLVTKGYYRLVDEGCCLREMMGLAGMSSLVVQRQYFILGSGVVYIGGEVDSKHNRQCWEYRK
jgi:hypothetical protein